MLQCKENPFRGVEVVGDLPDEADAFTKLLNTSLTHWQATGIEHVWLTIPQTQASFVPLSVEMGFEFHHCKAGPSLTLIKRFSPDVYVLHAPSHLVGVGAVVINDSNEILVVQELNHADQPGRFKLPGGYVDPGEHMASAVEREVEEETGVRVKFKALHCFRHLHKQAFGSSNLYFVCSLTPLSHAVSAEQGEIHDVRWIDVDEWLAMDTVKAHPKGMVRGVLNSVDGGLTLQSIENYSMYSAERVEIFLPKL